MKNECCKVNTVWIAATLPHFVDNEWTAYLFYTENVALDPVSSTFLGKLVFLIIIIVKLHLYNDAVLCMCIYMYVFDCMFLSLGYIKDNNYTLVDVTNVSTRWGVWSPSAINLNQSWADERGLNSLQILSGLLSAYRITGKVDYLEAWKVMWHYVSVYLYMSLIVYYY